ncbi:hypothetical protein DFH07DRAFT_773214 [Mycena maculata]|uniref:Uncharacterized protein n=1 Tax=Mycena maculata TaxID=230809 RepID=A0AAD7J7C6_9AGAR|nr:hypothetical protein DFH07DRAFT_773214 [Mycena maculata]
MYECRIYPVDATGPASNPDATDQLESLQKYMRTAGMLGLQSGPPSWGLKEMTEQQEHRHVLNAAPACGVVRLELTKPRVDALKRYRQAQAGDIRTPRRVVEYSYGRIELGRQKVTVKQRSASAKATMRRSTIPSKGGSSVDDDATRVQEAKPPPACTEREPASIQQRCDAAQSLLVIMVRFGSCAGWGGVRNRAISRHHAICQAVLNPQEARVEAREGSWAGKSRWKPGYEWNDTPAMIASEPAYSFSNRFLFSQQLNAVRRNCNFMSKFRPVNRRVADYNCSGPQRIPGGHLRACVCEQISSVDELLPSAEPLMSLALARVLDQCWTGGKFGSKSDNGLGLDYDSKQIKHVVDEEAFSDPAVHAPANLGINQFKASRQADIFRYRRHA